MPNVIFRFVSLVVAMLLISNIFHLLPVKAQHLSPPPRQTLFLPTSELQELLHETHSTLREEYHREQRQKGYPTSFLYSNREMTDWLIGMKEKLSRGIYDNVGGSCIANAFHTANLITDEEFVSYLKKVEQRWKRTRLNLPLPTHPSNDLRSLTVYPSFFGFGEESPFGDDYLRNKTQQELVEGTSAKYNQSYKMYFWTELLKRELQKLKGDQSGILFVPVGIESHVFLAILDENNNIFLFDPQLFFRGFKMTFYTDSSSFPSFIQNDLRNSFFVEIQPLNEYRYVYLVEPNNSRLFLDKKERRILPFSSNPPAPEFVSDVSKVTETIRSIRKKIHPRRPRGGTKKKYNQKKKRQKSVRYR